MDAGKILLGIALVVFSAALIVHPSAAALETAHLQVGSGGAVFAMGSFSVAESPVDQGQKFYPVSEYPIALISVLPAANPYDP